MITMTEFIEKVDSIMGQKIMDDKKANQLCHLYAMIFKNGYNACVEDTAVWLKAMLWKNPKTRQEELVQAARKEYPEWEEAQCHFIDGAQWADAHPDIDVRTMAAWRGGYKEAIEKACEWLYEYNRKQADKMFGTVHTADVTINVAQFRKATKGE